MIEIKKYKNLIDLIINIFKFKYQNNLIILITIKLLLYFQDWCRYCGARYSSNFTKGPWGPRTLCTIHYIEWN